MHYKIQYDGALSSIVATDEDIDDYEVFKTFSQAKKRLRNYLDGRVNEYRFALQSLKELRKCDIHS